MYLCIYNFCLESNKDIIETKVETFAIKTKFEDGYMCVHFGLSYLWKSIICRAVRKTSCLERLTQDRCQAPQIRSSQSKTEVLQRIRTRYYALFPRSTFSSPVCMRVSAKRLRMRYLLETHMKCGFFRKASLFLRLRNAILFLHLFHCITAKFDYRWKSGVKIQQI